MNKSGKPSRLRKLFSIFSEKAAHMAGHPIAFVLAMLLLLCWAATGPFYGYSETWQIVINTATTIVTFLLVFIIQSSQNRETRAIQLKLDELIRSTKGAHNALLDLEHLTDDELEAICKHYENLAQEARKHLRRGERDDGVPEVKLAATAEK
jgi:low affinity Fe/Cu permease